MKNLSTKRPAMQSPRSQQKATLFIQRVAAILGISPEQVPSLLRNRPYKAVRVQSGPHGVSREALAEQLESAGITARPLPWFPEAFLFASDRTEQVSHLPAVRQGGAFIQNPSSYLPIVALEPQGTDRYLDVCAAPGGKAALFASLGGTDHNMWLNDKSETRNHKLDDVLRQLNLQPAAVTNHDGRHLKALLGDTEGFDKILVDAECSTEGGVNFASRNPLAGWSLETIEALHHLQTKFAVQAYDLLKPGGTMVYSTCTFAPEENEGVITKLLERRPEAIIQKLVFQSETTLPCLSHWEGATFNPAVAGAIRMAPTDYMEGFFLCRIVKPTGDTTTDRALSDATIDLDALAQKRVTK